MLRVQRILFSTDFSEAARQALPYALFLAEHFGAELQLLHALGPQAAPSAGAEGGHGTAAADRAPAERALQAIVAEHGIPASRLVPIVRDGVFPDAVILDQARDAEVDLVVIGTHGRRAGDRRSLLGSTAEQVVHFAPCPVLV